MSRKDFVLAFLRLLALPLVIVLSFALMLVVVFTMIAPVTLLALLPRILLASVVGFAGLIVGLFSPERGAAMWSGAGYIMDTGEKWLDRLDPVMDVVFWPADKVYPNA